MKRRWKVLIGLLVAAVPAYWWLVMESAAPDGVATIDLAELRKLASWQPGEKPTAIHVEKVAEIEFPETAVVAGASWSSTKLPVFSYQLVFPEQRTVVVDTAMDEAGKGSSTSLYDAAAFARVRSAMEKASLIVITHEHFDHFGGLMTHPKRDELAARLTDEQLSDPSKTDPLVLPQGAFPKRLPFTYERAVGVAPGVVLWKSPGHTPGSQLVYVQLQSGEEFLFLGDVAWHARNWREVRERARLATLMMGEDRGAVLRQLAGIKALAAQAPKLHVVPGHDGPTVEALLGSGALQRPFVTAP